MTDQKTDDSPQSTEKTSEPEGSTAQQIVEQTQALRRDTQKIAEDIQGLYSTATSKVNLGQMYQDNPYAVLGAALGIGYVLGGGLFTPFTRRLWRVGSRAFVVPVLFSQLKNKGSSNKQE